MTVLEVPQPAESPTPVVPDAPVQPAVPETPVQPAVPDVPSAPQPPPDEGETPETDSPVPTEADPA